MSEIVEPARHTPIVLEVDVAVVGGGCAGIAAALAAARNGARVALIEKNGFLGGCATATMMDVFTQFRAQENWAIRGIAMEVVDRLRSIGAVEEARGYEDYGRVYFDHEKLKSLADQMMSEARIHLRLHSLGVSPIADGSTVKGVITESKSGRQAIMASVVIDVSGDADIASRAGAECDFGRDSDGLVQPLTLNFMLHGVDASAWHQWTREHPSGLRQEILLAHERGDFNVPRDVMVSHRLTEDGVLSGVNFTRVLGRNPTVVEDLTAAEIEARKQVWQIRDFLRSYAPGFEHCEVAAMATQINGRESRRVVGEYVFSDDDLLKGARFSDAIAKCPCFVDLHNPTGWDVWSSYPIHGEITEIPYRCLVPKDVDGLLVGGKCISATHVAVAGLRYLVPSFATGQAAGTAAALAVQSGVQPRNVDVSKLREALTAQGAIC